MVDRVKLAGVPDSDRQGGEETADSCPPRAEWPSGKFADPATEASLAEQYVTRVEVPATVPMGNEPTKNLDSPSATDVSVEIEPPSGPPVVSGDGSLTWGQADSSGRPSGGSIETGRVFDNYELLEEVGRGGMGIVYKARELGLNRIVALKMILASEFASPSLIQRFRMEAKTAALFEHHGIVPIYHIGLFEGQHFYTMGFVDGQSLSDRVADGPLLPVEAARIVRQVAEAIQHAHAHNIIHRDLKPANILIDSQGRPKVTDFGLAKMMESDAGLTTTGQILGTPNYMAPEQAAGNNREVNAAADIYALGAILYCLLTGRPPFPAPTPVDALARVIHDEPITPRRLQPKVDRDLETICLKCLAKQPAQRYATAQELADDLKRYLEDEPIQARPPSLVYRVGKFAHRRRHVLATLTAAAVLGASFLLLSWWLALRARATQVNELISTGRLQLDRAHDARPNDSDALFEEAMKSFVAAQAIDPRDSRVGEELINLYLRRCERAIEVEEFDAARALILPLRNLDRKRTAARRINELERLAQGTARLRIDSTPPVCDARISRLEADSQPDNPQKLGTTPIAEQDIAPGDYLLSLSHPGFAELRYPIRIGRNETRKLALTLLRPEEIPEGMVYVPAGPFLFGDPQAGKPQTLDVDGFFIDRTEVTGELYEQFVQATGTPPPDVWMGSPTCPEALRASPVYNVSWFDAYAYAHWAGKRLPTEVEWEKAARGVDGRAFPWGNRFDPKRATCRATFHRGLQSGGHRSGASPYGCLDMAGNVWEWTLDRERPGEDDRVIRGGASSSTPDELVAYRRKSAPAGGASYGGLNLLGFRCVRPLGERSTTPALLDALMTGPDLGAAAEFFGEDGRWALARECCRRLFDLNPRSLAGNFWLAAYLEKEGKTSEALAALRLVYIQNYAYRTRSRLIAGELQRLLAAETKAGRKPDRAFLNVPRWFQAVSDALDAKQLDKAAAELERILEWDPDNGPAHEQMATIEIARHRPEAAARHRQKRVAGYRQALREAPDNAELVHEFAEFLFNHNLELGEAAQLAQRAVEIDPYMPAYRKTYAELLAQSSKWDEAIAQIRQAIEFDPEDDAMRELLVSYKNSAQRTDAARP
jgi:serine/threonine protein kinase/formylglycine-generating enzyme required for sulfatase activity